MKNKFKILLVLVVLTLTVSLISTTYSRYVVNTIGNLEMQFAKWQILVNENDITNNTTSEIVLSPIVEENENIRNNTIAPTSKGYFDIAINPENVEVSFDYKVSLELLNENMPDLLISNYSLIDSTYTEDDTLTLNNIENNTITGSLNYDNTDENFTFKPFTIRVYFEWYDGDGEMMDNNMDTEIQNNNETLNIKANIEFTQKI